MARSSRYGIVNIFVIIIYFKTIHLKQSVLNLDSLILNRTLGVIRSHLRNYIFSGERKDVTNEILFNALTYDHI